MSPRPFFGPKPRLGYTASPIERAAGTRAFGAPGMTAKLTEGGRLTSDPNRSSLGLLPSGPDPVGEWLVHRQPPASYIGGTERECKRRWGFPC